MRKQVLFLVVMVITNCACGQNWQCLQPNVIRHFNGIYVRSMKIDSIQNINNDIVFFPFHTPRGAYAMSMNLSQLDSTGGSWLGKKIILKQDGKMLFDTYWGDTAFIQTNANLGDSWTFYNDTSSSYYSATITSIDTTTILSSLDSIKTITITAYENGNLNPSDLVHNQQIILSKNHGFYKTFSIYTFPFHPAQFNSYQPQKDFILDKRDVVNNVVQSYKLFQLAAPTFNELFDYNVGDVFEYEYYSFSSTNNGDKNWSLFSVLTKTQNGPNNFSYTIKKINWTRHVPDAMHPSNYWYTYDSSIVTSLPSIFNIDTNSYQESNLKIIFDNNQFCHFSTLYNLNTGLWSYFDLEPCYLTSIYKNGIGEIEKYICIDPSGVNYSSWLIYTKKNNLPCGNYVAPVGINELEENIPISVTPNPTQNHITINGINQPTVAVYNLMGQKVIAAQISNEISLASLPNGIYIVHVFNKDMELASKVKVVKE